MENTLDRSTSVNNTFSISSILQKPSSLPTTESIPGKEVASPNVNASRISTNFSTTIVSYSSLSPTSSQPGCPQLHLVRNYADSTASPSNLWYPWSTTMPTPTPTNYLAAFSPLALQQALSLQRASPYAPNGAGGNVGLPSSARPVVWGASSRNNPSSNVSVLTDKPVLEIPRSANHSDSNGSVESGSSGSSSENESEFSSPSENIASQENQTLSPSPPPSEGNKGDRGNFKKARTSFTNEQIKKLELKFNQQKYLARKDRTSLARALGLTEKHVKTWFQNRRTKWKKECSDEHWSKHKEMAATIMYMQHIAKKNS